MTPPVDDPEALRQILANTEALLLDFDGPICSVFAGIPAPVVAAQLRDVLAEGGHADLPDDIRTAADPFEVLFYAAKLGQDEARYVEAAFRAHEVEAVASALPTPNSDELIHEWNSTGRQLAIVSNNSVACVETYLDRRGIRNLVANVSARTDSDVSRLKPNNAFVLAATAAVGQDPSRCTFVGDSATDVQAALSAGTRSIAYANKPGKARILAVYGPDVVITSMDLLSYF